MRIVLATIGSLGDLHPFIGLGLALKERGAQVLIASASEYQDKVRSAGIEFAPLRPSFADVEADLGLERAQITARMMARPDFLFRRLVMPYLDAGYEDMMRVTAGADLLLTGTLAFGARLAAEKRAVPWVGVVLQPLMFLSAHDPPVLPGLLPLTGLLRRLPPAARGRALSILKSLLTPLLRPVRRLRARVGLAPRGSNPLFEGQFCDAGAIALYSSVLGAAQADYPQPTLMAGFSWYDSEDGQARPMQADLGEFLASGEAPLVFTLGSVVINSPGDFYRNSAAAACLLGRRAVLLVGDAQFERCSKLVSGRLFVARYAPHSQLFARAAAVIHHGGIGTLAQALRGGKPQLIVPFFADQFDNADRARRRCGAQLLLPRRYTAAAASRRLAALIGDAAVAKRAAEIGALVSAEDGAAIAARAILGGRLSRGDARGVQRP